MPLIEVPERASLVEPIQPIQKPEDSPEQDTLEIVAAGMAQTNPISSAIRYGLQPNYPPVPDYNPFTQDDLNSYNPEDFIFSQSPEETADIKRRIDRQRSDRQMLASSDGPAGTLGAIAGGVGNPILWAPMLLAPEASIPALIAAEAGVETVSEAFLHQQQPERTLIESAINVTAAGAVSGILGTVAKQLSRSDIEAIDQSVSRDIQTATGGSGGAAKVLDTTIEEESLVGGAAAETAAIGPLARILQADSLTARQVGQQLADNPFLLEKHEFGKSFGPSVEARLGRYEAIEADTLSFLRKQYQAYRKGGGKKDFAWFDEQVARALRRRDEHGVPEVAASAKYFRANVFNPTKKAAQELGLLPEDRPFLANQIKDFERRGVKFDKGEILRRYVEAPDTLTETALSYFPRLYNHGELANRMPEFAKLVEDYIYFTAYEQAGKEGVEALTRDEAKAAAESVIRHTFAKGGEEIPRYIVPKAGALQERTLLIPDAVLEAFLLNSASRVASRYLRQIGADIEITKTFGQKSMRDVQATINEEYDRLIANSRGMEAQRLRNQRKTVLTDLRAIRDRLVGTYEIPNDPSDVLVRAGAAMRAWNTLTMMGGVVFSSIPDIARPIMQYGLKPYLKGMTQLVTNLDGFNLSRAELKRWGVGLDMTLGSRMAAVADAADIMQAGQQTSLEWFGRVSGINLWNAGMKQFAGVMSSDTIINWAAQPFLGRAEIRKLARAGISDSMRQRIAQQFEEFGIKEKGLRIANADEWTDREAAEALQAAVRSEVDLIIITPGAGDKPLILSTEVGKMVGQFQSFMLAAHNRMLVNGLQQRDSAFLTGLVASVALGMLSTYIKNTLRGKDLPETPEAWLVDGLDRSGVLGVLTYPVGWARVASGDTPSRFAARNVAGTFLGPTPGQAERVARLGIEGVQGKFNHENAARLIPYYSNLWHLRELMEQQADNK